MRINKINVLGEKYKVIFRDAENDGEVNFKKKMIIINKNLTKLKRKEALIHEIYHIFFDYYHLKQCEPLIQALTKFHLFLNKELKGGKK